MQSNEFHYIFIGTLFLPIFFLSLFSPPPPLDGLYFLPEALLLDYHMHSMALSFAPFLPLSTKFSFLSHGPLSSFLTHICTSQI